MKQIPALFVPALMFCMSAAADVPAGYTLIQDLTFEEGKTGEWIHTDARAWKIGEEDGNHFLELHQQSKYKPPHRSPVNIALLKLSEVGSFVMEVRIMQTGREYGHRDACIFFGLQDPAHFYYSHIATQADPHAHQIMIVNNEPRKMITEKGTDGAAWGQNVWRTIRVTRDAASGVIEVFFEGTLIQRATDTTFARGYLGIGSFDDTARFDDLKVWAPDAESKAFSGFGETP